MEKVFNNRLRENSVNENYNKAMLDKDFSKLAKSLNVSEKEIKYNVSNLENTLQELASCKNCPGLAMCQNKQKGYVNYPKNYNDHLVFSYTPCRYEKEFQKAEANRLTEDKIILNASMKDIDVKDKKRASLIKWLVNFIKEYNPNKEMKGLYLHGSFGSGKTYLISAMFNELKKNGYSTYICYYSTILRDIKNNFDISASIMNDLETVDLLLIDDIGAEKVSDWSRDEILGSILQSRMNNMKTTFFTSNFNIEELEKHLSGGGSEIIKARRIIERIKQLTTDMELLSINRRK